MGSAFGLLLATVLIIGGIVIASRAHSHLQTIESYEGAFGGLGGPVIALADALGATNVAEAKRNLEIVRAVSVGAVILGVLVGLMGVAAMARSPAQSHESPRASGVESQEPGVRRGNGRYEWHLHLSDDTDHIVNLRLARSEDKWFLNYSTFMVTVDDTPVGEYIVLREGRFDFKIGNGEYRAYILTESSWFSMTHHLYVDGALIP